MYTMLFQRFDAQKSKKTAPGRINWRDIRSFIEVSKLPDLPYERYVIDLEPNSNGILLYKSWKATVSKVIRENPLPKVVDDIEQTVMRSLRKIDMQVIKSAEDFEAARQARHKPPNMEPKLYEKKAEDGVPLAQFYMGSCYHFGRGVAQSYDEAFKWYNRAALSDHVEAMCVLAYMHERGLGTPKLLVEAFEWYERAAKAGLARAQRNLAICYEYGRGTDKDIKQAFQWYNRAARNKIDPDGWAEYTLKWFEKRHNMDEKDEKDEGKEDDEKNDQPLDVTLIKKAERVKATLDETIRKEAQAKRDSSAEAGSGGEEE
eukprot:CAMPEP_0167832546 /NCGR_PEP_ID=MMETSP0112_2-20121227/14423_1 /TAXON_ID=91324 /ORGANISM="Lotharella globosa, Strain CCCM811" /LENGTH=316 /DNA_ID=CAMNT_0007737659 /DNA_START=1 /DNA_END=951 /DNA_ORIENTATION=-